MTDVFLDPFCEHAWFNVGLFVCTKCSVVFEPPMEIAPGETIDDACAKYCDLPKAAGWKLYWKETFPKSGIRLYSCYCKECSESNAIP